jgi:hypothetical protein
MVRERWRGEAGEAMRGLDGCITRSGLVGRHVLERRGVTIRVEMMR